MNWWTEQMPENEKSLQTFAQSLSVNSRHYSFHILDKENFRVIDWTGLQPSFADAFITLFECP